MWGSKVWGVWVKVSPITGFNPAEMKSILAYTGENNEYKTGFIIIFNI